MQRGGFGRPFFLSGTLARASLLAPLLALICAAPALAQTIRFATYNASLNRATDGALRRDLSAPGNAQANKIAEVIQRVRPDVLLINEFDYDAAQESARLFQRNYLAVAHGDAQPIRYPYSYSNAVNTGLPTGLDLDRDGRVAGGNDAYGFGQFPGQYGMLVLSRFPIDQARVRTFQHFLWRDMPGAAWPENWYSDEAKQRLRLSSKSHWDLPLRIGNRTIHLLVSHPTPPVFDGPEDRNGRRNHDEIRLWADYITPARGGYLYDDAGLRGGLDGGRLERPELRFVIMGDQNADPDDGGSFQRAIHQLLDHPRIRTTPAPRSDGAAQAAQRQAGANAQHTGDPAEDTGDFDDRESGNLRADYVLPSRNLQPCGSGVYWPTPTEPAWRLVSDDTAASSDHRLVWADLSLTNQCNRNSTPTGQ